MNRIRIEPVIAWLLLFVLGLVVVHAPLVVFVESHWPHLGQFVKAWKELFVLAALLLLAVLYTMRRAWGTLKNDRLIWVIALFAALHLLSAIAFHHSVMSTIAGVMIDLRFLAYFAAVYLFLKLYSNYFQSFLKVALLGAVIVVGFAVIQLALPHDFLKYLGYSDQTIPPYMTVDKNPAFIRENSTLRGPNPLGAYAVIVVTGVVAFGMTVGRAVRDNKVRYLHLGLAIAGLVALFVSYSRSAWIGMGVSLAILFAVRYRRALTTRMVAVAIGCVIILGGIGYLARGSYLVQNLVVHDNPTTGASVDSNAAHLNSLKDGLIQMIQQPFGAGVGSTGSASLMTDSPLIIENHYLFVAHEVGWLGLALFLVINYMVLQKLWLRRRDWRSIAIFASGIGLAVVGLMLPVWTDDTVSIVWWGLAGVMLVGKEMSHGTTTNKKAKRAA